MPDLDAQIACVKREIALRQSVYPGLVDRRKMTPTRAAHEQLTMGAVLVTLQTLKSLAAPGELPALEPADAEAGGR